MLLALANDESHSKGFFFLYYQFPKCLYLCINKQFIKRMKLRNTTSTLCKGHNKAMEGTKWHRKYYNLSQDFMPTNTHAPMPFH